MQYSIAPAFGSLVFVCANAAKSAIFFSLSIVSTYLLAFLPAAWLTVLCLGLGGVFCCAWRPVGEWRRAMLLKRVLLQVTRVWCLGRLVGGLGTRRLMSATHCLVNGADRGELKFLR